jgi:hypothetical protein
MGTQPDEKEFELSHRNGPGMRLPGGNCSTHVPGRCQLNSPTVSVMSAGLGLSVGLTGDVEEGLGWTR